MPDTKLPKDEKGKLLYYAWPGGYPIYYLDGFNEILCPDCAEASLNDPDEIDSRCNPQDSFVYWEGPMYFCFGCNKELESAYGDPEEEKE